MLEDIDWKYHFDGYTTSHYDTRNENIIPLEDFELWLLQWACANQHQGLDHLWNHVQLEVTSVSKFILFRNFHVN